MTRYLHRCSTFLKKKPTKRRVGSSMPALTPSRPSSWTSTVVAPNQQTMINNLNSLKRVLLAFGWVFVMAVSAAEHRGLPPQEGIANFGKVNEGLYRGAQPDEPAIKNLKRLGIKTIINLRMTNEASKAEQPMARTNGISYTNVPIHGVGRPADEQVRKVLALIEALPGPVFVHCEHGCDRTGTIIACYRIKHDRWSPDTALREAARYGMSWLERGMRSYVLDFAKASAGPAKN